MKETTLKLEEKALAVAISKFGKTFHVESAAGDKDVEGFWGLSSEDAKLRYVIYCDKCTNFLLVSRDLIVSEESCEESSPIELLPEFYDFISEIIIRDLQAKGCGCCSLIFKEVLAKRNQGIPQADKGPKGGKHWYQ